MEVKKINTFFKTNLFFLLILIIVIFTIYSKSIFYNFVGHDDTDLITKNINYISSIKNLPKLFLTSCYYSNNSFYYRPILSFSFAAEAIFFGMNPKTYHITNIILFILAIYLIYVFLSEFNLNKNILKAICLLTAVHPMFTSCLVWIPARNDVLLLIFLILSLINFKNYVEFNKAKYLILHCLFFTMALFTKETMSILIIIYILFIYCFHYKITKKQIIKNVVILLPIIIIYFNLRSIAVAHIDFKEYIFNWHKYETNIVTGIMTYVYKFIIPNDTPIMLYKIKISMEVITLNIFVLIFLSFLYIKKIFSRKSIIFTTIWFVLLLTPTFFQKEYVFLPHRLILSSVAIIIIMTLIITQLINKYPILKKYLIILYLTFFIIFGYLSHMQMNKYKKADAYWTNAYVDAYNYHLVINGLAKVYLSVGDYNQYKNFIYEAYRMSTGDRYIFDIVSILIHDGNVDEAEKICLNILSDKEVKSFLRLGSLRALGEIYFIKNNIGKAYRYTKKAYEQDPYDASISEKLEQLHKILENSSVTNLQH